MKTARFLTTAALAVMFVAPIAAQAQTTMPQDSAPASQAGATVNPPTDTAAPAANDAASPVAATTDAAPMGSSANPIPENSPTPAGQASTLVAGDPTVVSNGPIPDTKANRARYGQPMSATGRETRPAGN